jgi:hypothetical protein
MRLYTYCKGKSREDEMREQQLAMLQELSRANKESERKR